MSELKTFYYLVTSQIILLILVSSYAVYMTQLNCPQYQALQDQFENIPFNETSPLTALSNTWSLLSLMFTGCSGIPWWIYIIIFAPALIAMVVYVTPFIGS
jgi:hypothetical protein